MENKRGCLITDHPQVPMSLHAKKMRQAMVLEYIQIYRNTQLVLIHLLWLYYLEVKQSNLSCMTDIM